MEQIRLRQPKSPANWLELYRLYMEAFPAEERKPIWMIFKMYQKGKTDIWCLEKDGKFVGLGITINSDNLILLDYFAVKKQYRGCGIGSAAIKALIRQYAGKGFFLEIESTLEEAPNETQRKKRKQFYLSAGLKELHVTAKLFGVNMELLGLDCQLTYDSYKRFYRENYNEWAANHIFEC